MPQGVHLSMFPEFRQQMSLTCINLEQVTALLYTMSPVSHSSHERINQDLIKFLQEINEKAVKKELSQEDYIVAIVSYQFLAPILGVDVSRERETFCNGMDRYNIEDPLTLRFRKGSEENPEEPIATLDEIVEDIQKEHVFDRQGKRDYSEGFRKNVRNKSHEELRNLTAQYSDQHHLLVIGYCFVLSPSIGIDAKTEYKEKYDFVLHKHGKGDYCILVPKLT